MVEQFINPLIDAHDHPAYSAADYRIIVVPALEIVTVDQTPAPIHGNSYGILALLVANTNRLVPQDYLCRNIWGETDYEHQRRLVVNIFRIREKLGKNDLGHKRHGAIQNYYGIGYCALSSMPNR